MSTDGTQTTLDGERAGPTCRRPRSGVPLLLWHADPATSWERVCRWIVRAQEEGVI